MRAKEFLNELADQPYAFQYAQHGANKSRYGFETDSGAEYTIDIYPASSPGAFQNNLLSVGFALIKDGEEVDTATGSAGSDSLRIFSTVLAATKDALVHRTKQGLDIEYIQFAAKHAEPSRVSLYQRFAKNINRYLPGWEFVDTTKNDEYVRFIVKRS